MLDHLPDEPSAPSRKAIVTCPNCQAPCPLGFADTAVCSSCNTPIALPKEITGERDRRREENRKRRKEDPIFQKALTTRRRAWRSPTVIAALSYSAPFLGAAVGYQFGYKDGRYGQAGFIWLSSIGLLHFLTGVLLETRKVEELRKLLLAQRVVSGETPTDGKGRSEDTRQVIFACRVCTAPLSPDPGERDCSCDHCGADNILGSDAVPGVGKGVDAKNTAPRPDIFDSTAAMLDVYGDELAQRSARLYPLTIFLGFVVLAVLTFFAVEAPRSKLP